MVTIEEETVFPWTTAQDDAKALDALAKANGVTLAASGTQDVFWLNLVATLLGASHRIEAVVGRCVWNVDDYGPEVARHLHIGRPKVEFDRHVATFGWPEFMARQTLDALVSCLGMSVASTSSDVTPVVASDFIYCRSLGVELKAGEIMGTIDRTVIDTREGARFELAMEGRLYREGETDDNQWDVFGEPRLSLRNAGVPDRFTTCSTMVKRIPDVVAAPPGLLSLDKMPVPSNKRELRVSQPD